MKQRKVDIERLRKLAVSSNGVMAENSTVTIPITEATIGITAGIYATTRKKKKKKK